MSRLHRCGGFLLSLAACRPGGPHAVPPPAALANAESVYAATLTLKDRLDILTWRGRLDSVPAFRARYLAARTELVRELAIDSLALADTVDRRALAVMRRAVAEALTEETESTDGPAAVDPARCVYDAQALADADSLQSRLYDCYGVATRDVVVDGERLDRLTVLGLPGVADDGARRRRLAPRIPRDSLLAVNRRFYRDLGADPVILGVHFDLEPRAGKDPVAFTTFGARPGFTRGAWQPGEPWVFASYAVGGLDNLGELLHETGHAIHIAAIRTRPAFSDWPDADLFTEAIADLADGEAYDGRWQAHYLGDSAPPSENRRAAYFGVMMDACWSLFEARMQRDPALDPNIVWTELTSRYLRVVPHPELSWWAMRGQLIDVPGYLVNYALGAFIAADLRARIREAHGAFTLGDSTWYDFVRERIYRFGLERSSQRVMEEFLGRPVSAEALLSDLRRGLSPGTGGPAH